MSKPDINPGGSMIHRIRQLITFLVVASFLGSTLWIAPAGAGMIGTDKVAADSQSSNDRERLKSLVARPELAKQLQSLGVPPDKAQERINAMTDSEVRTLAGRIDALPAGGAFTDWQWVMIIIGIIIVILLI
jgi:hypothetical protein